MSQRLLTRALVTTALAVAACATIGDVPGPALRAQHALGVRRLLVLGVSFPGIEPGKTLAQLREHVLERSAEYYAAQSWGKTTLVGEVKGWYRLPRPLEDYTVSPHNVEVDRRRVRLLVEDALNAAEKDVVLSGYDHIAITVGVETRPGTGYGMIAYSANPGMLSRYIRLGQVRMWEIATRGGQRFRGGSSSSRRTPTQATSSTISPTLSAGSFGASARSPTSTTRSSRGRSAPSPPRPIRSTRSSWGLGT